MDNKGFVWEGVVGWPGEKKMPNWLEYAEREKKGPIYTWLVPEDYQKEEQTQTGSFGRLGWLFSVKFSSKIFKIFIKYKYK